MTEVFRSTIEGQISKESLVQFIGKPVVVYNSETGLDYGVYSGYVEGQQDGVLLTVDGKKDLRRVTPAEGLDSVYGLEYETLGDWPGFFEQITRLIDDLRDYTGNNSGILNTNVQGYLDVLKLIAADSRRQNREIWNTIIGSLNLAEWWNTYIDNYRLDENERTDYFHKFERQILRLRELALFMVETSGGAGHNSSELEDLHKQLRKEKLARFALRNMGDGFYSKFQNGEVLDIIRDEPSQLRLAATEA